MLQYERDGAMHTLDIDDYTLQIEWDGAANTLHFSLPGRHPQLLALAERSQIYESETGQVYRVSRYDRSKSGLDIEAELDLDSLCAGILIGWDNRADAGGASWLGLGATVAAILQGTGWTLDDQSGRVDIQQMETFSGTPLEAITEAVEVWAGDLGVQYDNAARVVHLYSPGRRQPSGCYLTEELNLLQAPQVKGKAERGDWYNRLYLAGADGLMLPAPYYVENRGPDDPIVSHFEQDDDLTDAAALLAAATSMVAEASRASRSYTCKLADLARLYPERYPHLALDIYDTVILLDYADMSRSYQQVSRLKLHPGHPEKNEVTLAAVPGSLSATAGTTYSLARTAAARAYDAGKQVSSAAAAAQAAAQAAASATQAAGTAATTATAYIADAGGTVTFGRTSAGSAVSVQARADGLQFNGLRNKTALWTNPNPAAGMAAGTTVELDLSSYAYISVGFQDNLDGQIAAGLAGRGAQYITAAVGGPEMRAAYQWDYPRVRTFTVTAAGITFGAGGYIDPTDAAWHASDACCIPTIIYGFL